MLKYKDVIVRSYILRQSGAEIARDLNCSKSGVNDFLKAFRECDKISFPLPENITDEGIYELVYGRKNGIGSHDPSYVFPDYEFIYNQMETRKNMTLVYLWSRYYKKCTAEGKKGYQYRQFCSNYNDWLEENDKTIHQTHIPGQSMEVDFAGKTFLLCDPYSDEKTVIVVFVAILPYSQYIYAEGMTSTKEPQWIEVNNNALSYFGGVPAIVICDNCKQAVIANEDWIDPVLNKDYASWAEHNQTAILPAKVKKPKFKSSVENAVGILEKGFFHDMEEQQYFSLREFNNDLWNHLDKLNHAKFQKKEHDRSYYWEIEREELMPLPAVQYEYTERKVAKVSSDYHVRFDNAYYSVDKAYIHQRVSISATADSVRIYTLQGELIAVWSRATRKGQWMTDTNHLPANFRGTAEWNAAYFINRAMTIGPNTVEVIKTILASRKIEVQTYRLCIGVLNFSGKYSKQVLEECCKQAIEIRKANYSFIKNTIAAIAEEFSEKGYNSKVNEERNKGAYVMDEKASDLTRLLSKSQQLIDISAREADHEEH